MATFLSHLQPTIGFYKRDKFFNFHIRKVELVSNVQQTIIAFRADLLSTPPHRDCGSAWLYRLLLVSRAAREWLARLTMSALLTQPLAQPCARVVAVVDYGRLAVGKDRKPHGFGYQFVD